MGSYPASSRQRSTAKHHVCHTLVNSHSTGLYVVLKMRDGFRPTADIPTANPLGYPARWIHSWEKEQ